MIDALIIAAAMGSGVFCLGLLAANWLETSTAQIQAEFEAGPVQREKSARIIRAVGRAFRGLAGPFPQIAADLDQDLTHAGRPYGGVDGTEYLSAAMVIGAAAGLAIGGFMGMNALLTGSGAAGFLAALLRWSVFGSIAVCAFLLLDVKGNASRTSDELEREFPFFLDLAILVVQAGGTPRKALAKYVEASPGTPLSREIAITSKDADATAFDEALHRMAARVRPTSVKTILKNLAQGEKSSGEAEQFYTDQAEELRFLREEMANRTAERLKTNIVFPVFLMLMAIIIAALAPTIVSIRAQGFF